MNNKRLTCLLGITGLIGFLLTLAGFVLAMSDPVGQFVAATGMVIVGLSLLPYEGVLPESASQRQRWFTAIYSSAWLLGGVTLLVIAIIQ